MKLIIIVVLITTHAQACFKTCFKESKEKNEKGLVNEVQEIAQKNEPKNETLSLAHYKDGQHTKTIARTIHYSQANVAQWTLKIVDAPNSCISIVQDETAVLYENQNLFAKKETNNDLYLWNLRIHNLGTAKLQAMYTSPGKVETQEFTITIVD